MLLQLFKTFGKIGAFTLGGGYAMIPIIEDEVVDKHHWISREEFIDLIGRDSVKSASERVELYDLYIVILTRKDRSLVEP